MLYDIVTVFWREWVVLRRRLGKFILSRMIAPMLYLVAFGWGLGRSIQVAQGASYLDFLVPGILALNSMNISFNGVGAPLHTSRVFHKSLEEYLVAPIRPIAFVIGKVLSGVVRGLISSVIIIALAYLFGAHFQITGMFLAVLTLNCIIFSALGFVAAMLIDSHEDMGSFNTYVLLPMSFLCGTFFATDKLPEAIHYFLMLLPLTHTSSALRSLAMQGQVPETSILVLFLYMIVLLGIGIWTIYRIRK